MLAVTVAVAPACATKKFVRGEVGNVNTKVDTLSGSLEETQERTRRNEERIGAVDHAGRSGRPFGAGSTRGADAAAQRGTAGRRRASTRCRPSMTDVVAASRKLVYEVTLSEDQGNFKFGKSTCRTKRRRSSTRWSVS